MKKWSLFGSKTVKPTDRNIVYAAKLAHPLTILSSAESEVALTMFKNISKYTDRGSENKLSRAGEFLTLLRDQLRHVVGSTALVGELYCQLIRQSTGNPNANSLERVWEVFAVLILSGVLPDASLMNVIIGHADHTRYLSTSTGAFALLVHSALYCHVKSLKETGALDTGLRFPHISEVNYELDVIPLHFCFIPEKVATSKFRFFNLN